MLTEKEIKDKANEFLNEAHTLAIKIGELAKSENKEPAVFMFSLLTCVEASKFMDPVKFEAVEKFFNVFGKEERGN